MHDFYIFSRSNDDTQSKHFCKAVKIVKSFFFYLLESNVFSDVFLHPR